MAKRGLYSLFTVGPAVELKTEGGEAEEITRPIEVKPSAAEHPISTSTPTSSTIDLSPLDITPLAIAVDELDTKAEQKARRAAKKALREARRARKQEKRRLKAEKKASLDLTHDSTIFEDSPTQSTSKVGMKRKRDEVVIVDTKGVLVTPKRRKTLNLGPEEESPSLPPHKETLQATYQGLASEHGEEAQTGHESLKQKRRRRTPEAEAQDDGVPATPESLRTSELRPEEGSPSLPPKEESRRDLRLRLLAEAMAQPDSESTLQKRQRQNHEALAKDNTTSMRKVILKIRRPSQSDLSKPVVQKKGNGRRVTFADTVEQRVVTRWLKQVRFKFRLAPAHSSYVVSW
jgi:hypothetical protein